MHFELGSAVKHIGLCVFVVALQTRLPSFLLGPSWTLKNNNLRAQKLWFRLLLGAHCGGFEHSGDLHNRVPCHRGSCILRGGGGADVGGGNGGRMPGQQNC